MGKHLTNFEQSLKQAYEKYEAPYQSGSWQALEQRLDLIGSSSSSSSSASVIAAAAAAIFMMIASTVAYVTLWNPEFNSPVARIASEKISTDPSALLRTTDSLSDPNGQGLSPVLSQAQTDDEIAEESVANRSNGVAASDPANSSIASGRNNDRMANVDRRGTQGSENEMNVISAVESEQNESDQGANNSNELSFAADVRTACAGTSVAFHLTSGSLIGSYLWNFGDGNFSSKPDPIHVYSKPGVYDVTLSVTSHSDGVIRSRSIKNMIVINPVPDASFDWEFTNDAAEAPAVRFINRSEHASEASWMINGSSVREINPEASFTKQGDYPVKLVVMNQFGCSDSVYQYISIKDDFKLLAPDAFSPNNDGLNDTFMPEALKIRNVNFKLTIYDNNQPIFESTDKYNPWKGVLPNGTLARPGKSFPWVVTLINEEGKEEVYSGTITITP